MKRNSFALPLVMAMLTATASFHALGCGATSSPRGPRGATIATQATTPASEPLAWLAGRWRCVNEAGTWEEHWYPPIDGTIAGSLRWTRPDGTLALLELFSIEPAVLGPGEPVRPVLFLRHFNAGLEPWSGERGATPRYTIAHADERRLVALSFPDQLTEIRYLSDLDEGDGMTVEVFKRAGAEDEWSRRVYLAFQRAGPR